MAEQIIYEVTEEKKELETKKKIQVPEPIKKVGEFFKKPVGKILLGISISAAALAVGFKAGQEAVLEELENYREDDPDEEEDDVVDSEITEETDVDETEEATDETN